VGLEVKHRQLARQVGALIDDPPEDSMASLKFACPVLEEGTTFIFGSWVCIANSSGGFNSHLANTQEPEASTPTSTIGSDNFLDNLNEMLPYLARELEVESIPGTTPTTVSKLDSTRSEELHTRFPLRLRTHGFRFFRNYPL
jgi:hypothetical protein